jgi:hypothetical protein
VKTFKKFSEEERLQEDGGGGAGGAGGGSGAAGGAGSGPGASGGATGASGCTCGTTGVNSTCGIHGSYGIGAYPKKKRKKPVNERFLTRAECLKAYHDGVRDGTIGKCPNCGSPNLSGTNRCPTAPDFDYRTCVDCGEKSNKWRINEETCPICKTSGQVKTSGPFRECSNCKQVWNPALQPSKKTLNGKKTVEEDEGGPTPTNNAGQGNVAGIGVGPQGEPGVSPIYQRQRNQLKLMNGPAIDPRMFADKIFQHTKKPVSESASDAVGELVKPSHDRLVQAGFDFKGKRMKEKKFHQFNYEHPTNGTKVKTFINPHANEHQQVQHHVNGSWVHKNGLASAIGQE